MVKLVLGNSSKYTCKVAKSYWKTGAGKRLIIKGIQYCMKAMSWVYTLFVKATKWMMAHPWLTLSIGIVIGEISVKVVADYCIKKK